MIGIYKCTNKINGKIYIGQSTNIRRRWWEHVNQPSPYSNFDKAIQEYGVENFTLEIIEICDGSSLDEREKFWIKEYNSINDGYNIKSGGNNYRGESNPWSKLTQSQVYEIIKLLELGKLNNKEISKLFNVSRNTIDLINRCKTWSHLHNYKNNIRNESLSFQNKSSTLRGERHPSSKITEQQAQLIIDLLQNTNKSQTLIAKEAGCSLNIVYDINKCRTWKYLHNYTKKIRNKV